MTPPVSPATAVDWTTPGIAFAVEMVKVVALGGVVDESDTILHLGCLQLARIDGKSPAEYLTATERETVRAFARDLIQHPPQTIEEAFNR